MGSCGVSWFVCGGEGFICAGRQRVVVEAIGADLLHAEAAAAHVSGVVESAEQVVDDGPGSGGDAERIPIVNVAAQLVGFLDGCSVGIGAGRGFAFEYLDDGWTIHRNRCFGLLGGLGREGEQGQQACGYASMMCHSCSIFAVNSNIFEAEQYLSADSFMARSTEAGFRFLPVTV